MADCEHCPSRGTCSSQQTCTIKNNPYNDIKYVIGVMSGKGGVGKSTVTALLARAMKRKGLNVGVMDADITGPSMPRLMGVQGKPVENGMFGLLPTEDEHGIPVMSLNLLLESEDQPVIWRGPVISSVIGQFWKDVFWGKLDVLLIDLPPGTGDVALTVLQSLPVSGVVLVSVADSMVSMIVKKALNMARKMETPVLGVVQNMAYAQCRCGERVPLFDDGEARQALAAEGLPLLAELPFQRGIEGGNAEVDRAMDIAATQILG